MVLTSMVDFIILEKIYIKCFICIYIIQFYLKKRYNRMWCLCVTNVQHSKSAFCNTNFVFLPLVLE